MSYLVTGKLTTKNTASLGVETSLAPTDLDFRILWLSLIATGIEMAYRFA